MYILTTYNVSLNKIRPFYTYIFFKYIPRLMCTLNFASNRIYIYVLLCEVLPSKEKKEEDEEEVS